MIRTLDLSDRDLAERLLVIQHRAYAVEAELIGFDGIPPLHEGLEDLMTSPAHWLGRYDAGVLVGAVAYQLHDADTIDITRLIVEPLHARQGHGRALLDFIDEAIPRRTWVVSTGTCNTPAVAFYTARGFRETALVEVAPGVTVTQFSKLSPTRG